MAEYYLPPELQQIIFKELMYSCARGLEFRSQIQDAWFKVNLKRLERAIKTGSQATYLTALKQLFLDMDGLVLLPSERREKYYRDIARSHFIYKHRINKAKLWVVGFSQSQLKRCMGYDFPYGQRTIQLIIFRQYLREMLQCAIWVSFTKGRMHPGSSETLTLWMESSSSSPIRSRRFLGKIKRGVYKEPTRT